MVQATPEVVSAFAKAGGAVIRIMADIHETTRGNARGAGPTLEATAAILPWLASRGTRFDSALKRAGSRPAARGRGLVESPKQGTDAFAAIFALYGVA